MTPKSNLKNRTNLKKDYLKDTDDHKDTVVFKTMDLCLDCLWSSLDKFWSGVTFPLDRFWSRLDTFWTRLEIFFHKSYNKCGLTFPPIPIDLFQERFNISVIFLAIFFKKSCFVIL